MDTISRESNSSPLPIVGVIAGLLALVLAAVALVKVSSTGKLVVEAKAKADHVDVVEADLAAVRKTANDTASGHRQLYTSVQTEMTKLYQQVVDNSTKIASIEEAAAKKAAAPAAKAGAAPAVAGPGEYIIKAGDTFVKIAAANGTTAAAIAELNPTVNPNRMAVGTRIRLPARR